MPLELAPGLSPMRARHSKSGTPDWRSCKLAPAAETWKAKQNGSEGRAAGVTATHARFRRVYRYIERRSLINATAVDVDDDEVLGRLSGSRVLGFSSVSGPRNRAWRRRAYVHQERKEANGSRIAVGMHTGSLAVCFGVPEQLETREGPKCG